MLSISNPGLHRSSLLEDVSIILNVGVAHLLRSPNWVIDSAAKVENRMAERKVENRMAHFQRIFDETHHDVQQFVHFDCDLGFEIVPEDVRLRGAVASYFSYTS